MALSPEQLVEILNDLLETCYDGLEGFQTAASKVKRSDLIMSFQSRGQRIDEAAAELYTAIRRLGGHPAEQGHPEARLHRGWMQLRAMVTPQTDEAILAEVERGEEEAVRHYHHALAKGLPEYLHDLVADQLQGTQDTLAEVKELRRAP
jgi:uncharacterized protein (TIGR02284 family)